MVESDTGLGPMIDALMRLHRHRSAASLAQSMAEVGYPISQQAISNYVREDKVPTPYFIVGFIKALGIEGEQRRQFLDAWFEKNPDVGKLLALMRGLDS